MQVTRAALLNDCTSICAFSIQACLALKLPPLSCLAALCHEQFFTSACSSCSTLVYFLQRHWLTKHH